MNTIMQRLMTNWHLMRIIRLVLGVWLLVAGIQMHDWATGLFSMFFLYQAVTDTGCCGSQGCATPAARPVNKKDAVTEEIEYEEVK